MFSLWLLKGNLKIPQMAPFYWGISLVLVWVVLGGVCVLVWWLSGVSRYWFYYKQ